MSVLLNQELFAERGFLPDYLSSQLSQLIDDYAQSKGILSILLRGESSQKASEIAHALHGFVEELEEKNRYFVHYRAREFLTCSDKALLLSKKNIATLFLSDTASLSERELSTFLQKIQELQSQQNSHFLLLVNFDLPLPHFPSKNWDLFQHHIELTPLYLSFKEIDAAIYHLEQLYLKEKDFSEIKGFSLEATAHIHRAILQKQKSYWDLKDFFEKLFQRIAAQTFPLERHFIVAWPLVRMLEEIWGYRLHGTQELEQEIREFDFQSHLFSASLEAGAHRSGFSRELIEQQCQLLNTLIDELPEHQKNYQGLTARLDQLMWIGMKLISNARTQAEMRDFFAFGGTGKIPKATTKLKFDQYHLEEYGFRPDDSLPFPSLHDTRFQIPFREEKAPETPIPSSIKIAHSKESSSSAQQSSPSQEKSPKRALHRIEGEMAATLFQKYQDLFTILAADPLTIEQLSALLAMPPSELERELEQLIHYDLLVQCDDRYCLPADDLYLMHTQTQLHFLENNLTRYLGHALNNPDAVLENLFLKLPSSGLKQVRHDLIDPFLTQRLLPLSDNDEELKHFNTDTYDKQMYALLLIGTHRLSSNVHQRISLAERIPHYFREACLQRVIRSQKHQAICLQATLMLTPEQAKEAKNYVIELKESLKAFLPQGRGHKPNFNQTLCFTRVPLSLNIPKK